jgi:hypothetical protein
MSNRSGAYVGATAGELGDNTIADKVAGGVSQKALFRHRGSIALTADALVLSSWDDGRDLVLRREDIASLRTDFIDRKELMETTRDRAWEKAISTWLGAR